MPPELVFVLAVGVVVLLLPVGVFIAAAVRFGSDERDRRLAALRLIGADRAMAVRIAAGEALAGALAGLALGTLAFLALRPAAELVHFQDISIFAEDVRPSPGLVALIAAAVPATALLASLLALRRVVVEPLGVTRRAADVRRRLGWRLVPVGLGAAILATRRGDLVRGGGEVDNFAVSAGVLLMLVGIIAVLPWLVDAVIARLRGGGVSWLLAVRRLQVDGGTAARAVGGVAVAVAGAIALQSVLAAGQEASTTATGADLARAQVRASLPAGEVGAGRALAVLRGTPGVARVTATTVDYRRTPTRIGPCADLREYAVIATCRDGDAFATVRRVPGRAPAGTELVEGRPAPDGYDSPGLLLTPGAATGVRPDTVEAYVAVDPSVADAVDRVRNAVAALSPNGHASEIQLQTEVAAYRTLRRAIFAAALAVLALIAASLLVGGLEQLRERRPVLAALSAFGVPRRTLAWSVLWQAAVPVVLGTAVSVTVGIGLSVLLLRIADQPLAPDWAAVAGMAGAGGAVILAVTLATLPALSRLMRPQNLRAE